MPRKRAPDNPDAVWHLTQRVNWRVWHLQPETAYRELMQAVGAAAADFDVDVFSYAAMSNHVHSVVRSPAEDEYRGLTGRRGRNRHWRPYPAAHPKSQVIGQFVRQYSLRVARRVQERLGISGHFWERRHDRVLIQTPRQLIASIAYDHRNPVKASMVLRAEDYERSSAAFWAGQGASDIHLMRRSVLPFGLSWPELRAKVLKWQKHARLDEVMEALRERGLRLDSEKGAVLFDQMLAETGLIDSA
ncbi:MAG: transposase [Planctomycetota bacterium]|jgi:REP element-mobilizing transposase RayT